MRRHSLNIAGKMIVTTGLVQVVMAACLLYVVFEIGRSSEEIRRQAQSLQRLEHANNAYGRFLELRYWLSDTAVSWQRESEEESQAQLERLQQAMADLEQTDAEAVRGLRPLVDEYVTTMRKAIDAYIQENRVLGNAHASRALGSAQALDQGLAGILSQAQAEAWRAGKTVIGSNAWVRNFALFLLAISLVVGVVISVTLSRRLTRPLRRTVEVLRAVASGDLTQRLEVKTDDELGLLAQALNETVEGIRTAIEVDQVDWAEIAAQRRREKEHAETNRKQAQELKAALEGVRQAGQREREQSRRLREKVDQLLAVVHQASRGNLTEQVPVSGDDAIGKMGEGLASLLEDLRRSIRDIASHSESLSSAAGGLAQISQTMTRVAHGSADKTVTVNGAASEVRDHLAAVSSGTQEMSAAIEEIAKNVHQATAIAGHAAERSQQANALIDKLNESSQEIGNVVAVITAIAEQTNLLALNATIESARAGEMGAGFAVVAAEVKDLARGTARATKEIEERISKIQEDTSAAVEAISGVCSIIEQINQYQSSIAAAVEQQTATTVDISGSIEKAARVSREMVQNVEAVAEASQQTMNCANETQSAARLLIEMASEMHDVVGRFQYQN
ncbi:MAG TPA: methyl-accepting chemotaxis protein [Acidobacteria bacterium]|nr:methyl-accepting chemotaxis protein [Acidobacteriota bacterium]